MKSDLDRSD